MIKLIFMRQKTDGREEVVATRSSYTVPRPGEWVSLNPNDASVNVDRVEYHMYEAPKDYYDERVTVWIQ